MTPSHDHTPSVSAEEQVVRHTAGPWIARADPHSAAEWEVVRADPSQTWNEPSDQCWYIATIMDGANGATAEANARLIAGAPELLAALQQLIPTNINLDHPGLGDDVVVSCDVTLGELRAARDAIIKAGG